MQKVGDLTFFKAKKARKLRSKIKVMLIVFFEARGVVHFQLLPQGQTVNQHVYKMILQHLLQAVRTRRSEMWKNKSEILHHDWLNFSTYRRYVLLSFFMHYCDVPI